MGCFIHFVEQLDKSFVFLAQVWLSRRSWLDIQIQLEIHQSFTVWINFSHVCFNHNDGALWYHDEGYVFCFDHKEFCIIYRKDKWCYDGTFKDSFQELYKIKLNKNCKVLERASGDNMAVFQWRWRRQPRRGKERDKLTNLSSILANVKLSTVPDKWCWK